VAIGQRGSAAGLAGPGEPLSPTSILIDSLMAILLGRRG
jgi:hypothetical protein